MNVLLPNAATELDVEDAALNHQPYFIYPSSLTCAQNCTYYDHVSKARRVDSILPKYFPVQTQKS